MGETACSPSCARRPCGRQQCATVLLVQEVHHHRHQRLRRHHPPRRQRLLPTLTWQMSVMPTTRELTIEETTIIQGTPPADRGGPRRAEIPPASSGIRTDRPRPIARTTSGSTFTSGARLTDSFILNYALPGREGGGGRIGPSIDQEQSLSARTHAYFFRQFFIGGEVDRTLVRRQTVKRVSRV